MTRHYAVVIQLEWVLETEHVYSTVVLMMIVHKIALQPMTIAMERLRHVHAKTLKP